MIISKEVHGMRWGRSERDFLFHSKNFCHLWLLKWEYIACILFLIKLISTSSILCYGFMSSAFQPWKKLEQNYLTWKPNMMKKLLPSKSLPAFSICMCLIRSHLMSLIRNRFSLLCSHRAVRGLEGAWPLSHCKECSVIPMSSLCCQFNTRGWFCETFT